jgi:hypothetical protein
MKRPSHASPNIFSKTSRDSAMQFDIRRSRPIFALSFFLSLIFVPISRAQIQPGQLALPTAATTSLASSSSNSSLSAVPAALPAATQDAASEINGGYEPITLKGRVRWWMRATLGPTSLFDGGVVAGYQTAFKHPPQWGAGWDGFGRRYALRLSGIGLSTAMEGSIGAAWGEDPRYFRAGQGSFKGRIEHAVAAAFVDRYSDGSYRPAYARFIAIPTSNLITNSWRPASETTASDTAMRIGLGFAGRMGSNMFKEFWPDVGNLLFHRH